MLQHSRDNSSFCICRTQVPTPSLLLPSPEGGGLCRASRGRHATGDDDGENQSRKISVTAIFPRSPLAAGIVSPQAGTEPRRTRSRSARLMAFIVESIVGSRCWPLPKPSHHPPASPPPATASSSPHAAKTCPQASHQPHPTNPAPTKKPPPFSPPSDPVPHSTRPALGYTGERRRRGGAGALGAWSMTWTAMPGAA
ncbi:hypothetical protein J2Z17_003505 [Rhizobium halophytocola]|uniref:Uncharacterized protein n=1 Tax=Rhizobium halophytocola TaxID=735519 RepID=A0ABS4E273_9HYPH|nr:hypothetical protein [Rhizobium halophytocola]